MDKKLLNDNNKIYIHKMAAILIVKPYLETNNFFNTDKSFKKQKIENEYNNVQKSFNLDYQYFFYNKF